MIDKMERIRCNGCATCASVCPVRCISMEEDPEGFQYPAIDYDRCLRCNICEKSCPVLSGKPVESSMIAYACRNNHHETRMISTSGGVFSALAERILDRQGVVFGAKFDEQFNVILGYAENRAGLDALRRSKYVQSRVGNAYREAYNFLKQGREVLFCGTPCQIEGLKSFTGSNHDNLYCVDLVCLGVPSPLVWQKYLAYQKKKSGSEINAITFRYKDAQWKWRQMALSIHFEDGGIYRSDKDLYVKGFIKGMYMRPSCHACKFKGANRCSDITLADFWGIEKVLPEMDDLYGTSLVILHTEKGIRLMEALQEQITAKEVGFQEAIVQNSPVVLACKPDKNRDRFMRELTEDNFENLVTRYCAEHLMKRIYGKIKTIWHTIVRKVGHMHMNHGSFRKA